MKVLKSVIVMLVLFSLPFTSNAWGLQGHRIVGQIAESYLTPKAKKAIREILGDETMAISSNWPDFIKSDSNYKYLSPWHYVNFPDSMSYDDIMNFLARDTMVNVYTKTNWLIKELKNKSLAKEKKVFYLKLLIHFIGDIHEPMHSGRVEDLGGNKIKITWLYEPAPVNLHVVWDDKLVDFQQLSYTEYAATINHTTTSERTKWQKKPMKDWIYDSYVISRKIYQDSKPDSKLGYNYNFKWIGTVNSQLLKGGVRLAGILNDIFK
jgi:hypothetical protein